MAQEIERKFLVKGPFPQDRPLQITQGYLWTSPVVRVRLQKDRKDQKAYLTLKGRTRGISRTEVEYSIPYWLGRILLIPVKAKIEKTRYLVDHLDWTWEIDVFHGTNQGLVVAEVELGTEEDTPVIPEFCGAEVTKEKRYANSNLITYPYTNWWVDEKDED